MRESSGSSAGHDREPTGRVDDRPFTKRGSLVAPPLTDHTKGRSPVAPPLTDHTKGCNPVPPPLTDHTEGRSLVPPPLTDHTKGHSPALPHPPEGASKARRIEPVSPPGQAPPASG